MIEALPEIVRQHPNVVYLVLGATHPHLMAREGERYHLSLERLAEEHVIFYNRFVSLDDLKEFIGATDIYLTPYLNEAQITSGTLAYVFGAGKAVVSTPYWHAQELLAAGRGVLVPFRNPIAITEGVCGLLDDPVRMKKIRHEAYAMGREMIWNTVSQRYLESFQRARADRKTTPRASFAGWTLDNRPYDLPPLRLDHIVRMSDGTGIFQHAIFNVPNFHEGYCTDDNARAFILCNLLDELGDQPPRGDSRQTRHQLSRFPRSGPGLRRWSLSQLHEPRKAVAGRCRCRQRRQPCARSLGPQAAARAARAMKATAGLPLSSLSAGCRLSNAFLHHVLGRSPYSVSTSIFDTSLVIRTSTRCARH